MRLAINLLWAILALAFAFVILMFVWDNQTPVTLRLLGWQTPQRALADYVIFAFALGLVPSLVSLGGIVISNRLRLRQLQQDRQEGGQQADTPEGDQDLL